jgi:hypothetical protein
MEAFMYCLWCGIRVLVYGDLCPCPMTGKRGGAVVLGSPNIAEKMRTQIEKFRFWRDSSTWLHATMRQSSLRHMMKDRFVMAFHAREWQMLYKGNDYETIIGFGMSKDEMWHVSSKGVAVMQFSLRTTDPDHVHLSFTQRFAKPPGSTPYSMHVEGNEGMTTIHERMVKQKIRHHERAKFEMMREELRGQNQVEKMSVHQIQVLEMQLGRMVALANAWGVTDPTKAAGGKDCITLPGVNLPCAFGAKNFVRDQVASHQNLAILTFKGESSWLAMGYFPPPEVLVVELTHMPALKMMILNPKLARDRTAHIRLSATEYRGMMDRDVKETLFELWQMFCTIKHDPKSKAVLDMKARVGESDAHCEMMCDLYYRVVAFGQDQERALDYHCRLEVTTDLYSRWMQQSILTETRQPRVRDADSAKIQAKLMRTACGIHCNHPR